MSAAAEFPMMHDPKAESRPTNEIPNSGPILVESQSELKVPEARPAAEGLETVGRVAGGVAHDFNNLLTGILLYCDLLISKLETGHSARRYVEEIRNASSQASGLVRQLLSVARPVSGEPQPVSLNDVAEGMRTMLARLIGEHLELKYCLDPNLSLVRLYPVHAQQVLLNLALNARDAMPGGGEIRVETRNCRVQILADASPNAVSRSALPCVLLEVSDHGIGMDAATTARVFEAFFTTKHGGRGTGLGLSTVHDIVSGSGGLIHVESAQGRGTRVTVLLPSVAATLNSQGATPEQEKLEGVLPAGEKE